MIPADTIARAIVAAARETGENPESFVGRDPDARFRHYAFHALVAAFPEVNAARLADVMGAPGKPSYFMRSSLWWVLGQNPQRRPGATWWDEAVFSRVCQAIKGSRREPRPEIPVKDPLTGKPRLSGAPTAAYADPSPPARRDDFLRQAVENTLKLQQKE